MGYFIERLADVLDEMGIFGFASQFYKRVVYREKSKHKETSAASYYRRKTRRHMNLKGRIVDSLAECLDRV
jgi:hypothetical protein